MFNFVSIIMLYKLYKPYEQIVGVRIFDYGMILHITYDVIRPIYLFIFRVTEKLTED